MEEWRRDGRKEVVMVDLEALVPKEHLLRKIERSWIMSGCIYICFRADALVLEWFLLYLVFLNAALD